MRKVVLGVVVAAVAALLGVVPALADNWPPGCC
jgi:hypothetical protein